MAKKKKPKREITMRDLYPHLNKKQRIEAERNFHRYLEIVIRMYERSIGKPVITGIPLDPSVESHPAQASQAGSGQHREFLEMRRKKFESRRRPDSKK